MELALRNSSVNEYLAWPRSDDDTDETISLTDAGTDFVQLLQEMASEQV